MPSTGARTVKNFCASFADVSFCAVTSRSALAVWSAGASTLFGRARRVDFGAFDEVVVEELFGPLATLDGDIEIGLGSGHAALGGAHPGGGFACGRVRGIRIQRGEGLSRFDARTLGGEELHHEPDAEGATSMRLSTST